MLAASCRPADQSASSCEDAWQVRQAFDASRGDCFAGLTIFVASPPASTWALPGPWHDSQSATPGLAP